MKKSESLFTTSNTIRFQSIFYSIVIIIFFGSCSNNSTGPAEDEISGVYLMTGEKITTKYSGWPKSATEEPRVDTSSAGFLLKVEKLDDSGNYLRLYGLEGVDIGENRNRVFQNCIIPDECEIIIQLNGKEFQMNFNNGERSYKGTG